LTCKEWKILIEIVVCARTGQTILTTNNFPSFV